MNKYILRLFGIVLSLAIFSCSEDALDTISENTVDETSDDAIEDEIVDIPSAAAPNILFIIADDLGKDALNGFTEGSIKPSTPNIDAIRTGGLSFNNFWTYPTCAPTRAAILTGKYGYRTSVKGAGDVLAQSEVSLQQYISDNTNDTYVAAVVGKWHLAGNNSNVNPEDFGIDYYAGLIRGAVDDYYQWQLTEDGSTSLQSDYITEVFTDLSIDWIKEQSKPWFLWLAYNAPHAPFHVPPSTMHNQGNLPEYSDGLEPLPYYMAAIEAMDFQIGRLLETISAEEKENLVIIFIGDNGTPNQVAQSPYSSAKVKNTLYQGGVNVPMFISGSSISRTGTDDNLINSSDLFATIAQIAGTSESQIHDSKSFKNLFTTDKSIREYQYSEMNNGITNEWTTSNGIYKLIISDDGDEELYSLKDDAYENTNLLNGNLSSSEQEVKTALEVELSTIRN